MQPETQDIKTILKNKHQDKTHEPAVEFKDWYKRFSDIFLSISNSNIQVLNLLNARIIYQILRRHAS